MHVSLYVLRHTSVCFRNYFATSRLNYHCVFSANQRKNFTDQRFLLIEFLGRGGRHYERDTAEEENRKTNQTFRDEIICMFIIKEMATMLILRLCLPN
jgi:hypothetical protein